MKKPWEKKWDLGWVSFKTEGQRRIIVYEPFSASIDEMNTWTALNKWANHSEKNEQMNIIN